MYAAVGGAALISLLIIAGCFKKSRSTSNHKLQVSSNSADLSDANERGVQYEPGAPVVICVLLYYISKNNNAFCHFNRSVMRIMTLTGLYLRVLLSQVSNKDGIYQHLNPQQPSVTYPMTSMNPSFSPTFRQIQHIHPWRTKMTLPAAICERTGDGTSGRKHVSKYNRCRNTEESCANSEPPCEPNKVELTSYDMIWIFLNGHSWTSVYFSSYEQNLSSY